MNERTVRLLRILQSRLRALLAELDSILRDELDYPLTRPPEEPDRRKP